MYKHPGIIARLPRQHYSPSLLPSITFEQDGKLFEALAEETPLGTIKFIKSRKTGTTMWDYLEITLNDGTIVPCLRRTSPENNFCIVQNFSFKIVKPT